MTRPTHIFLRLLLVLVPLLMAMAPAMAQNTVYAGHTTELGVDPVQGDSYVWELYKDVAGVNFATVAGNCPPAEAFFVAGVNTGVSVNVMWTTPGTYFFKVTATRPGCTNNLKVGKMIVLDSLPTAVILPHDSICSGTPTNLTVKFTGTAPLNIIYTIDGALPGTTINGITDNPYLIPISPTATTSYQIISVTDANGVTNAIPSDPVIVFVKPIPVTSPINHD